MKFTYRFLSMVVMLVILAGCGVEESDKEKLKDLEYTIVEKEEIPEEFLEVIEGKKNTEFKLTYTEGEELYIAVGYGEQKTGGYSISVNELYLTSNSIYVDTSLLGPENDEKVTEGISYPYLVLKLEYMDKNVVFE